MQQSCAVRPILIASLLLICATAPGGRPEDLKGQPTPASTTTNDQFRPILINNIFNYYSNNGSGSYNPLSTTQGGFEFPKGDRLTTVFQDGLVWGVRQRDTIKVGGSVYRHGIQAGRILVHGTSTTDPVADDASLTTNRVYRVRRDIRPIGGVSDPGDARAAGELAILENEEVPLIGRYETVTASQLLQQYWDDWNGWPASLGAPYADIDHNGSYDPMIDIPGPPMADAALWYVANDMSSVRTQYLSGTSPIGLEMQRSVWAYRRGGAVGDAIFQSSRVINKSGVALDSVFLVQWADPDLGDAGDDLVGVDTTRGLGYVYNGHASDLYYGTTPPAVGFLLVQGPLAAATAADTAMFGFGRRPGYRNLPMSTFTFFTGAMAAYADPAQGVGGAWQWFNLMKGLSSVSGAPFIDPTIADTTRFVFAGDPVTGGGWLDGTLVGPADRRLCMVTGPFTMAAGDTQEIAVANLAARGWDRLTSVALLRSRADIIRQLYNSLSSELTLPVLTHAVVRKGDTCEVSFRADAHGTTVAGVQVQLKEYDGGVVWALDLADVGGTFDGAAGDSVFGGSVQIPPIARALYADAVVTYHSGAVVTSTHFVDNITTADLGVASYDVVATSFDNDNIPNPGESVRFTVSLTNASSIDLSDLALTMSPDQAGQKLRVASLGGHSTHTWTYNASDPTTYLAFDVPPGYADSTFARVLSVVDSSGNLWRNTLTFMVRPMKSTVYRTPLNRIAGTAPGSFEIAIVDSSKVKDHLYVIRGGSARGLTGGFSVKDSTTGTVLLENHELPDALGFTSPVIDGFKVLIGTVDTLPGMRSWEIPSGIRRFSSVGGYVNIGLEGFSSAGYPEAYDRALGTVGMAGHLTFGGIGSTLGASEYHTVLLKLAAVSAIDRWDPTTTPTDENFSRAYRYLGSASSGAADPSFAPWIVNTATGYPYQGYDHSVPFSAWDMESDPPVRLAVGVLENNVAGGLVDGRYWPGLMTGDNSIVRELGFIFKSPYTETPDTALAVNMSNNSSTPLMWVMSFNRRVDANWVAGDQFKIIAYHMPTASDAWTFNPKVVTDVAEAAAPSSFALLQNYPNPFNPSSDIRYQISEFSIVRLAVYDILGREVAVLVNEKKAPGAYQVRFDASSLSSGVYFYRLQVRPSDSVPGRDSRDGAGRFVETKKMLLLR